MIRADKTGFGTIEIFQDSNDFCYGIDAVLLAHFLSTMKKQPRKVADLGCGNGIVPLIVSHKLPDSQITGFELKEGAASLALKSVEHNGLTQRIEIINSDINDIGEEYTGFFDAVTFNPPYVEKGAGILNASESKMIARHETTAGIYDFMKQAARIIKRNGRVCVVYRPRRLADLIDAGRKSGLEPVEMRMICPHRGESPNIVLLALEKGKRSELKVLPELIVRDEEGNYTEEIKNIYEI